jgi:hypothetical protein
MISKCIKYGIFNHILVYDLDTGRPKCHKTDFGIFIPPHEDNIFCPLHPAEKN